MLPLTLRATGRLCWFPPVWRHRLWQRLGVCLLILQGCGFPRRGRDERHPCTWRGRTVGGHPIWGGSRVGRRVVLASG
ncbi:hypothetical protein BJV78DRAFT_1190790 [Lactifluus subvellereus]|nr:hypothetical protein BJV78DRAFT_1209031 [Lactifluus subvellereus]KAI0253624.1 hypothetical protein BJV78DRAFT_1190790 [Lactifluus subvellereus]